MQNTFAQNGHPFKVLLALTLALGLLMANRAEAAQETAQDNAPQLALVAPHVMGQLHVTAMCDGSVAAFKLTNPAQRWKDRGVLRLLDGATGQILRERTMVLGEGQTATFRVGAGDVPSARYRITVQMPNGKIAYVKTFTGRCDDDVTDTHSAQR